MAKFTIYLIYHSHIDIGYTERQEKIARYHADFTKQAVENVLNNPKFKYTAEGFWSVEQYLNTFKEKGKRKLIKAIKTKRFELTPGYIHMAELLNYDNLNNSLDYATNFVLENDLLPLKWAMACDINGFSWGYASALYNHGVRYLYTNINTHHGGVPFSKPLVPFYWENHEGNKILVWNGLTYHKANLLGLIPGLTFKGDPGVPGLEPADFGFIDVAHPDDFAKERIFNMVKGLKKMGYNYNFLPISGSGLYTDNSPIGIEHVDFIAEWNRLYGKEITIKLATLEEFFTKLEKLNNIPTYVGDWNDYWTDGVLSTPDETRLFRNAQRNQKLIKKLDPTIISTPKYKELTNALILYAEHTWGHSASWSDPYRLLVKQLDFRKANLAITADILSNEVLDNLYLQLGEGEFTNRRLFEYIIYNPHDELVQAICYLPTDFWEEGFFLSQSYQLIDDNNIIYPTQRTYTLRGAFIATLVELKPKEKLNLKLKFFSKKQQQTNTTNDNIFIGKYYQVQYSNTGITSIKVSNQEMITQDVASFGFPVYQLFKHGKRQSAAGFGYSKRTIPSHEFFYASNINFQIKETGALFTILRYEFSLKGTKKAAVEFTLFFDLPKILVNTEFAKDLEIDPEGLYVCFPFETTNKKWYLDKPNTLIEPGMQIPDTCCDYYPIDRGVILKGTNVNVAINALDTPMVTFERIKLWNFTKTINNKGSLFSWILNNKWETNFRTECAGYLESRYIVSFSTSFEQAERDLETSELPPVILRK